MAEPATTRPGGMTSPMSESTVTDLPQPDSPTIPSISPTSTLKETPSTARTSPARVLKYVWRSLTSSSAIGVLELLSRPWIQRVSEAVRDEERAEDQPADAEGWDDDDVGMRLVGRVPVLGQ